MDVSWPGLCLTAFSELLALIRRRTDAFHTVWLCFIIGNHGTIAAMPESSARDSQLESTTPHTWISDLPTTTRLQVVLKTVEELKHSTADSDVETISLLESN